MGCQVLKESFKIYCAINDGIINLVDMVRISIQHPFFEMPKHDAVKALAVYKRAGHQAEHLADFYEFSKRLDLARNFQFPTLRQPPPSFVATMEEYVKEEPQNGSDRKRLVQEYQERDGSPQESNEPGTAENEKNRETEAEEQKPEEEPDPQPELEPELPPLISTEDDDLLGLSEINPRAAELEESNALALAIIPSGAENQSTPSNALTELGTSGWELALVTTPSNINTPPPPSTKLAGGFDKLLLDSLYEDDSARRQLQMQNAGYGPYGMGADPT